MGKSKKYSQFDDIEDIQDFNNKKSQKKKKDKDKKFAAGCSRDVIEKGATMLGWNLDKLLELTLTAMKDTEDEITSELSAITA